MAIYNTTTHKGETKLISILHRKALYFIEAHARRRGEIRNNIIPYPSIYHTLSAMMHLSKEEAVEVFNELREANLIEVVPFKGIRLVLEG